MPIEKKTVLYEVLMRFGPMGYVASHQRNMDIVFDSETNEILSEHPGPAFAISDDNIKKILSTRTVDMAQQIESLLREKAELAESMNAAKAENVALSNRIRAFQSNVEKQTGR